MFYVDSFSAPQVEIVGGTAPNIGQVIITFENKIGSVCIIQERLRNTAAKVACKNSSPYYKSGYALRLVIICGSELQNQC